jgi:hypothetical protein
MRRGFRLSYRDIPITIDQLCGLGDTLHFQVFVSYLTWGATTLN